MLSEYYMAVDDFSSILKECGAKLIKWDNVSHEQRHRLEELGKDMVGFSESFIMSHINATMWLIDHHYEISVSSPKNTPPLDTIKAIATGERNFTDQERKIIEDHNAEMQQMIQRQKLRQMTRAPARFEEATQALTAAYKAFFFFIRAFQDGCYGMLLNIMGKKPGAYSSMNRCITRKSEPVFPIVESISGYVPWFNGFVDKRNRVKLGVRFSLSGTQWDVGVVFIRVTPGNGLSVNFFDKADTFNLSDLIEAFRYSTSLLELISNITPCHNESSNE